MLRYVAAAMALKAFSTNDATRALYRRLGNRLGERRRLQVPDMTHRVARGRLLVDLCRRHDLLRDGDRALEIGTGWMHWFGLYLRLYFDIELTAFDVWDNRQFGALQSAAAKLRTQLGADDAPRPVLDNLDTVLGCRSFDELYRRLNMRYLIDATGDLGSLAAGSFDFATSWHVLEHVPKQHVERLCEQLYTLLRPGGGMVHQIGIDDHLRHYDRSASKKQYLRYSERTWKLLFENGIQYINRLQSSDWVRLFENAGFRIEEQVQEHAGLDGLPIHPQFRHYSSEALSCTIHTLVCRKPHASA